MSTIRFYRSIFLTPSNSSPEIAYFTPTKVPSSGKKYSNYLRINKSQQYPNTKSAERFRRREKAQKNRTYQCSPRTPNYIRYKSIKKRLMFDDICTKDNKTCLKTSDHSITKIPLIKIHQESSETALKTCNDHIHQKSLHNGDQSTEIVRDLTPNLKFLLSNVIPFKTHQVLGRGRFGTVIKSEYKGKQVAVKYISKHKKNNSALFNERNGIGLNHPNIVAVELVSWSLVTNSGIVMMNCYENAQNLQTLLDDEAFPINIHKIIRYSSDLCHAICYLHSKYILHLDIKPKNILILSKGLCKLCDFGSSAVYCEEVTKNSSAPQFQGTVYYCAPEILKGEHPTPASDIYSIGITIWQIIHRTMPFDYKKREESLIYQIVKYNLRPFVKPSLSSSLTLKSLKNIYTACWNADFLKRPSASSIQQQLKFIENCI